MLNDNVLSKRLNAYVNNEILPELPEQIENKTLLDNLVIQFINLFVVFLKSLGYGYALKTILSTDWKFIGFLAVGFSIELFISTILDIFTKNK